ncbi:hypothetical protein [Motiliproteus sp.]|uniref:hypothetical protein n=1 Tax=Motiliproteus sp. TaxID=1898955 RepID=UPI003BAC1554
MTLQRLRHQMESDVDYLRWRARTHHQSDLELMSHFSDMADSYRRLVPEDQRAQFEEVIERYRAQLT